MAHWAPPIHLVIIAAAAAAPSSISSVLSVVLITIWLGFKLDDVLTIRVDGHGGSPIVEVARLRTNTGPGDIIEALVLLRDVDDAANDNEKATEQSSVEGI